MMPLRLESTDKAARAMPWRVVRFDGVLLAAAKVESVARRMARVLTGDVVGYARVERRVSVATPQQVAEALQRGCVDTPPTGRWSQGIWSGEP